jgi:hypothetical protein
MAIFLMGTYKIPLICSSWPFTLSAMLLTETQLRHLSELPSIVAHALPHARNPDVPFFLDDPAIRSYELLRSVWVERKSAKAACRDQRCSRTEY